MERWLNGVWYDGRAGGVALLPLAALFAAGAALRRAAFRAGLLRRHRVGVPVVVVGNLTVGGTGKTPLTQWLAERLAERGRRVGVLCRSYGGRLERPVHVYAGADPGRCGDEAVLLAGALAHAPGAIVVAGPDRVAGARLLESLGSEVLLCDDGLQHYALERDAEIVVVDGLRGLGNGRLLPAGPLREPPARLGRADLVVVNDADAAGPDPAVAARISSLRGRHGAIRMRVTPQSARQLRAPGVVHPLASFAGTPVHAVAGIGAPERFFAALERAGLRVVRHPFPDHHPFVPGDLEFGDGHPVLMTGKDAVKCRAFAQERMWEVTVRPQIDAADAALLLSLCARGA